MKRFFIRFVISILAFSISVLAVNLSRSFIASSINWYSETISAPETDSNVENLSGKIEVRFVEYLHERKDGQESNSAVFEVTNNTAKTVYYKSYGKYIYVFPKLKRDGKIVNDGRYRCDRGFDKYSLLSGKTVKFTVPDSEITYTSPTDSPKESEKPTQLGFQFYVGDQQREQIVWTDKAVKFPKLDKR